MLGSFQNLQRIIQMTKQSLVAINNSTSHTGRKVAQAPHERPNKLWNTSWLAQRNFNRQFVPRQSQSTWLGRDSGLCEWYWYAWISVLQRCSHVLLQRCITERAAARIAAIEANIWLVCGLRDMSWTLSLSYRWITTVMLHAVQWSLSESNIYVINVSKYWFVRFDAGIICSMLMTCSGICTTKTTPAYIEATTQLVWLSDHHLDDIWVFFLFKQAASWANGSVKQPTTFTAFCSSITEASGSFRIKDWLY